MQLKLVSAARPGQTDMIVQTKFGTRAFELGKVADVPDEEGQAILASTFGKCYQNVVGKPVEPKLSEEAVAIEDEPKLSPEEDAAKEATKMVSRYKNK